MGEPEEKGPHAMGMAAGGGPATPGAAKAKSPKVRKDRRPATAIAVPRRPPARAERTTRRSRKTRRDLIQAARAILVEQGVPGLTVKAVTDRADVGHGTFYHHFTSTEDVLAAGIEDSMRELAEAMARDYSDAADKTWVFVASLSRTFRMLASHAALDWMLDRPHVLASALREACGPFALRDLDAMVKEGAIRPEQIVRASLYWEWIFIGALTHAAAGVREPAAVEHDFVEFTLRMLGLGDDAVARLVERLRSAPSSGPGAPR